MSEAFMEYAQQQRDALEKEAGVSSSAIKRVLADRHSKDYFLTEVKDGPTWIGHVHILDGAAIAKSWAHPCITGYEVKISRSDWLRDDKWHFYLPLCHFFYIVAPLGVCDLSELPEAVGFLEYQPKAGRLVTRRKAVHKDIEVSADLLMYIIMSRLDPDRMPFYSSRQEYARAYLENKADRETIGREMGTAMAKRLRDLERLQRDVETLDKGGHRSKERLREIWDYVYSIAGYTKEEDLLQTIKEIISGKTDGLAKQMENNLNYIQQRINNMREDLDHLKNKQG